MRIVIKLGTSTLTHSSGQLNIRRVEELCKVVSDLKNAGHEIALVSSGSIAMGLGRLSLRERPQRGNEDDTPIIQAIASVGQCSLMYTYDKYFTSYNHIVSQILITGSDLENEQREKNFHNTMFKLFELGVLPIINENDTVGTEEILVGDNDQLGAIVARSIQADELIILTDIDGLFTENPKKNPRATLIPQVEKITPEIEALAGGAGSKNGTGGMVTKIMAAKIATEAGVTTIVANGENPNILYDIIEGKQVGTRFLAK